MKLLFLGPPGAGKGTQALRAAQAYQVVHISTGAMLREAIAAGTQLGLQAKSIMESGRLVPDDVVIGIVRERLDRDDCREHGFLLDGFPRTIAQAEALAGITALDLAVNIDVDEDMLVRRIAGRRECTACGLGAHVSQLSAGASHTCAACGGELVQRADDQEQTVRSRMAVYHAQTKPLIDFYERQGILIHVDGTRQIDAVFADIAKALEALRA